MVLMIRERERERLKIITPDIINIFFNFQKKKYVYKKCMLVNIEIKLNC